MKDEREDGLAKKMKRKKAVSKKKSASKKPARKRSVKAKVKSTRKTAAKRRPAKPAKRPATRKKVVREKAPQALLPPEVFTVDPGECSIRPLSHHVPPQILGGSVQFNATAPCTIEFSDPDVLGLPNPYPLSRGPNGPYPVQVEIGETQFYIVSCSRGTPSDPSDIIVP